MFPNMTILGKESYETVVGTGRFEIRSNTYIESCLAKFSLDEDLLLGIWRRADEGVEEAQARGQELALAARRAEHAGDEPEAHRLPEAQPHRGQGLGHGRVPLRGGLAHAAEQLERQHPRPRRRAHDGHGQGEEPRRGDGEAPGRVRAPEARRQALEARVLVEQRLARGSARGGRRGHAGGSPGAAAAAVARARLHAPEQLQEEGHSVHGRLDKLLDKTEKKTKMYSGKL